MRFISTRKKLPVFISFDSGLNTQNVYDSQVTDDFVIF